MRARFVLLAALTSIVACGGGKATPDGAASTLDSGRGDTGDGYNCHATLTGQLNTTLMTVGVMDTSYWYSDPTRVPAGEARLMFTCAGLGFRTTKGTTTGLFPRAPGHYVIADFTEAAAGTGTEGYNQWAAPPGEIATYFDPSLAAMSMGNDGFAVAKPGSFDISVFDGLHIKGTFSYTLGALTNGAPPLVASKQIEVVGDFQYDCEVGVPTARCQ
jgi:hypothetical protein